MNIDVIGKKNNNKNYDYIIIGGGPAGLTCAQILSSQKNSVLILDNAPSLGGCHRVIRKDGYFTEHGPRIYTGTYVNFMQILELMDLDFENLFVKYEFNIINLSKVILTGFTLGENAILTLEYLKFLLNRKYGENTSLASAIKDFTPSGKSLIDRICRTIDGGTIETYSINKFLHGIDDNVLYSFYQPKLPNDKGLFKLWSEYLVKNKVDIHLNSDVHRVNPEIGKVITLDGRVYNGKNIIVATPPKHLYELLKRSDLKDVFVEDTQMIDWVKKTDYIRYITVTFHWDKRINVPHKNRLGDTDWAISDIKLSHYMRDINTNNSNGSNGSTNNKKKEFVISAAVIYLDKPSSYTNKTADESDYHEVIDETFRQLNSMVGNVIPMYKRAYINPNVTKLDGKWIDKDTAFMNTYNNPLRHFPFQSKRFPNLFNVGTHNNVVHYHYTSLETAVTNALLLTNQLTSKRENKIKIRSSTKLSDVLLYIIVFIILILLIRKFKNYT